MPRSGDKQVPSLEGLTNEGNTEVIKDNGSVLWLEEIEEVKVAPWRDGPLIKCCLGRSAVIGPRKEIVAHLPFIVSNRTVQLAPCGSMKNLLVETGWRDKGKPLKCKLINLSDVPIQIGSRMALVAFFCNMKEVYLKRRDGNVEELKRKEERKIYNIESKEEKWMNEFPEVISTKIPGVRHFVIDDVKTKKSLDLSKVKVRTFGRVEKEKIEPLINEFLELGAIEEVKERPQIVTPLLTVPKKEGGLRLVLDFRMLNEMTETIQNEPMDRIKVLESVKQSKIWTTMDLTKGFLQVPIAEKCRKWFGLEFDGKWFRFRRCPFGWNNSMAYLARALGKTMNKIKMRIKKDVVLLNYVDDILIGTKDEQSHDEAVRLVLEGLKEDGWTVAPSKIKWYKSEIEFLGRAFSTEGIKPADGLIMKVNQLKKPTCGSELRGFFGLVIHFAPFSYKLTQELNEIAQWKRRSPEDFKTEKFSKLWERMKRILKLCWFKLDYVKGRGPWKVLVDASSKGMGGILFEGSKNVAMFSKSVKQQWRHSTELEIEAVVQALEAFSPWIRGEKIEVLSDNWATYRAMEGQNMGGYVLRRLEKLLEWNPQIKFIAGKEQVLADWLSRSRYWIKCGDQKRSINNLEENWEEKMIEKIHNEWHGGISATREIFKKRFGGNPTKELVEKVVKSCDVCQRWKKRIKRENLRFLEVSRKFEQVGMDFIGPLKKGPNNLRFCLIMIDYATRWLEVYPVTNATAKEAIKGIKKWEVLFERPEKVVTDYGPAFRGKVFADYCIEKGITPRIAAAFNHQANGMVERAIGTWQQKLSKLCYMNKTEWWKEVKRATKLYNNSPHRICKTTPCELIKGVDPFGRKISQKKQKELLNVALQRLREERDVWRKQREKQVRSRLPLEVGDKVLIYNWSRESSFSRKLEPRWIGPGKIEKKISETIFQIKMPNGRRHVYHGDMLERYAQGSVWKD